MSHYLFGNNWVIGKHIKKQLQFLEARPDIVMGLKEKAFGRVISHYNWEDVTEKYVKLFGAMFNDHSVRQYRP